jgi:putative membrane protein
LTSMPPTPADVRTGRSQALAPVALRGVLGGVLMGLANLVPGISGGTMLLAAGVYPRFVRAVADISTLRLSRLALVVVGSVVVSALVAVLLLAGTVKNLVVDHRWIMYSLFIGLTLGGAPVVWRLARPATRAVAWGTALGFSGMVLLALAQRSPVLSGGAGSNALVLGLAGLAGASAMILPGVSGGYLLLVLGQYVPILAGIDAFETALQGRDWPAALAPALDVLLPVGIGVVLGVVAVSNLLRWLLARFEKATLGVLLGLLLGAVVGLWPFQQTVEPVLGQTILEGRLVTAENLADFAPEDYPTAFFDPSVGQVLGAVALVFVGIAVTSSIARLGQSDAPPDPGPTTPGSG